MHVLIESVSLTVACYTKRVKKLPASLRLKNNSVSFFNIEGKNWVWNKNSFIEIFPFEEIMLGLSMKFVSKTKLVYEKG